MKTLIATILTVLLLTASAYANCGIQPIQPFTGCRGDLVPICVCDENGQNCQWIWICQGDQ